MYNMNLWWWADHYSMQAWILQAVLIILVVELVRAVRDVWRWRRNRRSPVSSVPGEVLKRYDEQRGLVEVEMFGETFQVPVDVAEAYGLTPKKK